MYVRARSEKNKLFYNPHKTEKFYKKFSDLKVPTCNEIIPGGFKKKQDIYTVRHDLPFLIPTGPTFPLELFRRVPRRTMVSGTTRRVKTDSCKTKESATQTGTTPLHFPFLPSRTKGKPLFPKLYGNGGGVICVSLNSTKLL